MTADLDLSRKLVSLPGFEWMPGMRGLWSRNTRTRDGMKPVWIGVRVDDLATHAPWMDNETAVPDLRDPATLGCLRELVRKAWGPLLVVEFSRYWEVCTRKTGERYIGDTEAAALVAALGRLRLVRLVGLGLIRLGLDFFFGFGDNTVLDRIGPVDHLRELIGVHSVDVLSSRLGASRWNLMLCHSSPP